MRFRQFFLELLLRLLSIRRMKPERVQPPFEVPLTEQRMAFRQEGLSKAWEIVHAPVAIRCRYKFSSFRECVDFLGKWVTPLAEEMGYAPAVQIDDNTVVLTLGIEVPEILSEGDFDFATALDKAVAADTAAAKTEQKDA